MILETLYNMYNDIPDEIKSFTVPVNIEPTIALPVYDNRRLGNTIDWICDNYSECRRYYHSLPADGIWEKEAIRFMQCQYDQQSWNKNWEEKHSGEYLDMANKDRYDNMINSRDGEG